MIRRIIAAVAVALPGCTSLSAADIARQAVARCGEVRVVAFDGGAAWESASARVECGAWLSSRPRMHAIQP